jgi:putative Holliday junction resolvase
MGRIMAIDYGRKRTGLAVTDTMQLIAGGLATVPSGEAVDYIKTYTSQEKVDLFVIGEPKQMNNKPSENMQCTEMFVNRLRKVIPDIPVAYFDERFTSVMAHKVMIEGGLKKKKRQDKALADEISAILILQGYMEKRRFILQTKQTDL